MNRVHVKGLQAALIALSIGAAGGVAAAEHARAADPGAARNDRAMPSESGPAAAATDEQPDRPAAAAAGQRPDRPAGRADAAAAKQQAALQAMTPAELGELELIGVNGREIGHVESVARSRSDGRPHALIATGGFLGLGERVVAVPLDELRLADGNLHLDLTEEELAAREPYSEERYATVAPGDRPVGEFAAFEPRPAAPSPAPAQETGAEGGAGAGTQPMNAPGEAAAPQDATR